MHRPIASLVLFNSQQNIAGPHPGDTTPPASFASVGNIRVSSGGGYSAAILLIAAEQDLFVPSTDYILLESPEGDTYSYWFDTTGSDVIPAGAAAADVPLAVDISGDTTANDVCLSIASAINTQTTLVLDVVPLNNGTLVIEVNKPGAEGNGWIAQEFVTDNGFAFSSVFGFRELGFGGGAEPGDTIETSSGLWLGTISDLSTSIIDFVVYSGGELDLELYALSDPVSLTQWDSLVAQTDLDATITQPAQLQIPSGEQVDFSIEVVSLNTGLLVVRLNIINVDGDVETKIALGFVGITEEP